MMAVQITEGTEKGFVNKFRLLLLEGVAPDTHACSTSSFFVWETQLRCHTSVCEVSSKLRHFLLSHDKLWQVHFVSFGTSFLNYPCLCKIVLLELFSPCYFLCLPLRLIFFSWTIFLQFWTLMFVNPNCYYLLLFVWYPFMVFYVFVVFVAL